MIYLDYAATFGCVPKAIIDYISSDLYGNPSSIHSLGRSANKIITETTNLLKSITGAKDIYYTSGSTESNNWIINNFRNKTIISSVIEHPSILNALEFYRKEYGLKYRLVGVDKSGVVDLLELEKMLSEGADLCSIMCVNNETGVIQDINRIYELCHKYKCKLHSDLTQAFSHIDITSLKYDYASVSAHKFGGFIGSGVLLCNDTIEPFIIGGHQQGGMRGGTYNLYGILTFGKAAELYNFSELKSNKITILRDNFEQNLLKNVQNLHINSKDNARVGNISSLSFKNIEGEALMLTLDMKGICVSSGSACNSGSLEPSHVLKAMGVSDEYINGTIRVSLSEFTTEDELNKAAAEIIKAVKMLRGE